MRGEVRSGGYGDGQDGETTPEVSQSPIVGYDSNCVIDDSTNDKIDVSDKIERPFILIGRS